MTATYYPEQPRETLYIGFEERELLIAGIRRQKHIRGVGTVVLAGLLVLVVVSAIL